jgi:hypothetical protein
MTRILSVFVPPLWFWAWPCCSPARLEPLRDAMC